MKIFLKLVGLFMVGVLFVACAAPELSPSVAMKKYSSVGELNTLLIKAEKDGVQFLAPNGYTDAKKNYDLALQKAQEQDILANKFANTGLEEIRIAMKNAENSKAVLGEVLIARTKAQDAMGSELYSKEYAQLEEKLKEATVAIEHYEMDDAKELRTELLKEYADLEVLFIKSDATRKARAMLSKAKDMDADDYAPKTLKLAQKELVLATKVLQKNRTHLKQAKKHSSKSVYYSSKSINITKQIKSFEKSDMSKEDIVLWYQDQLKSINNAFKKGLPFDKNNDAVIVDIQKKIDKLKGKRKKKR